MALRKLFEISENIVIMKINIRFGSCLNVEIIKVSKKQDTIYSSAITA